jgi:hypothetical protein
MRVLWQGVDVGPDGLWLNPEDRATGLAVLALGDSDFDGGELSGLDEAAHGLSRDRKSAAGLGEG